MKPTAYQVAVVGPLGLFTTVGSPPPFALSLSKGHADLIEAFVPHAMGFDRLSPNGDKTGLRYLSPNGSLRTVKFACGPKANTRGVRAFHASRLVSCAVESMT